MPDVNYWELIHAHRRLAAAGKVDYLRCSEDGYELVPVVNPENNDIPSMRCYSCGYTINLGSQSLRDLQAEVNRANKPTT